MKRIAILTSGGDAPGMNAAIRSAVRSAIYRDMEIIGIERGFDGLIDANFRKLDIGSVGDILHRGGTMLKTARSKRFMTSDGIKTAIKNMQDAGIEGLICIGGDGTFKGALELQELGFPVTGIPGTIDNDMGYTDYTIGFDTAVNTVLHAISQIRDTNSSHERTAIIEVMGRNCGDIALVSGLTGGADGILIPEVPFSTDELAQKLKDGISRGKNHSIIIKAEGVDISIDELKTQLEEKTGLEIRTLVLAYLQRGGSPTNRDRMLATLMANRAVDLMAEDIVGYGIATVGGKITDIPLEDAATVKREANLELIRLIDILSR